jgi:hypothetical protein
LFHYALKYIPLKTKNVNICKKHLDSIRFSSEAEGHGVGASGALKDARPRLAPNLFPLFVNDICTETNAFEIYLRENIAFP